MSFRSLLFCPDEAAARLVTQVLSELDFTVETAQQSFAAVQRLTEEHFHALVVDCQNEQDASLLFKAARNSAQNSGSLSVAVVEGQAGVAKAFRIGANLVLTKPINVEQSKSTLRVARGLLKKAQPKPAATAPAVSAETRVPAQPSEPVASKASFDSTPSAPTRSLFITPPEPLAPAITNSPVRTPAASVPFSGLVLDSEPEPVTEAADAAVLESLPEITGKRSGESAAPALLGQAEPIAAGSSGQAAAPALAPEPKAAELKTAGASPMVTNEPIVSTSTTVRKPAPTYEPEPVAPPFFSALEHSGRSSGGGWFLKIAIVVAILTGGGYFAWQQPRVRMYTQNIVQRVKPSHASLANGAQSSDNTPAAQPPIQTPPQQSPTTHETQNSMPAPTSANDQAAPSMNFNEDMPPESSVPAASAKSVPTDSIEVEELPLSRDSKLNATPKVQPILVKSGATTTKGSQQASAPPMNLVAENDSALPSVTPTNFELPKPEPGTIRISQGVSQGLLIKKVQPIYPPIARQLHRDGSVQLLATIDKSGNTKKVQILTGDPMLARSASDAVKQWKYRPYLLNGSPVEIETQITVLFNGE
jgi:periplasmic protein TonB